MKKSPIKTRTALKANAHLTRRSSLASKSELKGGRSLKRKQTSAKKTPGAYASVFGDTSVCYVTKEQSNIEVHHVFSGPYKTASERYGFVVALRSDYHRASPYAVHEDKSFDLRLKRFCQGYFFNELGLTKEQWLREFGRIY